MSERILGWTLDPADRAALLARFRPRYARIVADHVTHGRPSVAPAMPKVSEAVVIGRADDGAGVEALVVEIDGSSDRWDGSTYHLTWSLAEGRAAKESNAVIARNSWEPVEDRPRIGLVLGNWL